MPPITPEPSHIIHTWWVMMPSAEISSPPHQQHAATKPALRGPARSSQPPQTAAAAPRKTKYSVYIQPSSLILQSQVVANTRARNDMSGAQAIAVLPLIACDSGSQNTEKPYAMPMQRCIQSAAGGTSQRLNPAPAMIRSLASSPTPLLPLPVKTAASAILPSFGIPAWKKLLSDVR